MAEDIKYLLRHASREIEDSGAAQAYFDRHGIDAASFLTVADDETAGLLAEHLSPRIRGRVVVEIGGGIGLLALHLSAFAKRVFCIEANPMWATSFVATFFDVKPKNVSYLFGAADEFAGLIHGDVALFCTHSGVASMTAAAKLFAPTVIDVHGEIIAKNPGKFNELAVILRDLA